MMAITIAIAKIVGSKKNKNASQPNIPEPPIVYPSLPAIADEVLVWQTAKAEDLWPLDKLLLARHLGYVCGPVGIDVPRPDTYIVRPCVNPIGMGVTASKVFIKDCTDHLPVGYFWCELFFGRHLSVDYFRGKQVLCVEGFREDGAPLWRWSRWTRTGDRIPLPKPLRAIAKNHEWLNVEYIGGRAIECHFRANPDFWVPGFREVEEVIPVWHDEAIAPREGYHIVEDPDFAALKIRRATLIKAMG